MISTALEVWYGSVDRKTSNRGFPSLPFEACLFFCPVLGDWGIRKKGECSFEEQLRRRCKTDGAAKDANANQKHPKIHQSHNKEIYSVLDRSSAYCSRCQRSLILHKTLSPLITMKTVLLIGARGFLGSKVLQAVLDSKKSTYKILTLIRPKSNASKIEALGVGVARGDMMDVESLTAAMQGVDVVINTANGYGSGHPEVDTTGAKNVADAVKAAGVSKYIYCSVQQADKASMVEHFYDKYKHEEYCKEIDIPYICLRPGAFLDQADDYLGDAIAKGNTWAVCPWNQNIPIGMIYTPDLAQLFADAMDVSVDRKVISVGWTRSVTYKEVVEIVSAKVGRKMTCYTVPQWLRYFFIYTYGYFDAFVRELLHMFNFFDTGVYLNDPTVQNEVFGPAPTPEEVIGRYVDGILAAKEAADAAAAVSADPESK